MGVALIIQLATQPHNADNIHACILENGFTSFQNAASAKSTLAWLLPSKIFSVGMRSIDKVHELRVPVMYLSGLNDHMINPMHTKQLFQATINSKHSQLEVILTFTSVYIFPFFFNRFMKVLDIQMLRICLIISNDLIYHL